MQVDLTSDQELLRDTTAKFIRSTCPLTTLRELIDSETGLPADYLRRAAELGWFAMVIPEEWGGGSISGDGVRDLAIVAEERGRGLQPGPFLAMNVVGASVAARGSAKQQAEVLPGIVSGQTPAVWAHGEGVGAWAPGHSVTARRDGDSYVLDGPAGLVQHGGSADWVLVTASEATGLTQFLVPATTTGLTIAPVSGHDITQRFSTVSFADARVDASTLLGRPGGAADDLEGQLQLALVLTVAETIGALDVMFEMTRQYATDRIAFGRPIGSFQAVKHQLADMSMLLEAGKAISYAATDAVQAERADAGKIASMAKAWVSDTGVDIAQGCFQVFGGIGFTWEHDFHLFFRRVSINSLLWGEADWHRERICVLSDLS